MIYFVVLLSKKKNPQALGYMKNTTFRFTVCYINVNMKSNVAHIIEGGTKAPYLEIGQMSIFMNRGG